MISDNCKQSNTVNLDSTNPLSSMYVYGIKFSNGSSCRMAWTYNFLYCFLFFAYNCLIFLLFAFVSWWLQNAVVDTKNKQKSAEITITIVSRLSLTPKMVMKKKSIIKRLNVVFLFKSQIQHQQLQRQTTKQKSSLLLWLKKRPALL